MTDTGKGDLLVEKWTSSICAVLTQEGVSPTCAHVTKLSGGKRTGSWIEGFSPAALSEQLRLIAAERSETADTIEIVIGHNEHSILRNGAAKLPRQIERGLTGLAIRRGETTKRICPSVMLSRNKTFPEAFDALARSFPGNESTPKVDAGKTENLDISSFSTRQFVIPSLSADAKPLSVFRGKPVVPLEEVTLDRVSALARSLADWMKKHVAGNGKLSYCYHPSDDTYAPNTNRIREFMGTVALFKAARFFNDSEMLSLAEKNLHYNIGEYYRNEHAYGIIVEGKKVKLGAAALAALAIRQSEHKALYNKQFTRLMRLTDRMWQNTGSFRTFLRPSDFDGTCQNFYPGETLLLWAECWIETRDDGLWTKIETSFNHYREWHRANRNPAFVPWHTQACYLLWEVTGERHFQDFILEMNDWLLPYQQWDQITAFPDAQGRFYDPDKPYGPPHASSTGVYLEGLIDAFRVARSIGDEVRALRYALTIRRGLRNVMQLQYSTSYECSAYADGAMAFGGVRTTEYNNVIRIDNVQHNLMAVLKILQTDGFIWTA